MANGSIRDTVGDVQNSANRIRTAMETQAQTVTAITAAVDETALAADSMSMTIAAIRADTVAVAGEIDHLETGFNAVGARLVRAGGGDERFRRADRGVIRLLQLEPITLSTAGALVLAVIGFSLRWSDGMGDR